MTSSGNLSGSGGGNSPHLTEAQIMSIMCKAQNNNMSEVTNFASAQIGFSEIQTKAGQASEAKIDDNLSKIKQMSNLSMILGIVSVVATSLAGAGSSMMGIGASTDAAMESISTIASGLGNGVGPITEGGLQIAQGQISQKVGDNRAGSSVAGNLMKGFDEIGKDDMSTISQTVQDSAQFTSKEQSIISEDRQSKMYN